MNRCGCFYVVARGTIGGLAKTHHYMLLEHDTKAIIVQLKGGIGNHFVTIYAEDSKQQTFTAGLALTVVNYT